jgi:hypothetical protein
MTAVAHLNALYSVAPIVLWVEDAVTRDYLTKVWGDPSEIAFLIAGGNEAVSPAVETAGRDIPHVFGLIDRDFGTSNVGTWNNPQVRVFRLPRHEVENYCLDSVAIQGCGLNNRGRDQGPVDSELLRLASMQPSWLACRRVLSRMQVGVSGDFPADPKIANILTVVEAEQHIVTCSWYTQLMPRSSRWTAAGVVLAELQAAETDYRTAVGNGTWRDEFSGKEIFRQAHSFVYQPRNPGSHDSDFAKSIGDWQFSNNQVPADLVTLRSALRVRVGLPP